MAHDGASGTSKWAGAIATLLCFVALHTAGLVWFLSGISTTVRHLIDQIGELKTTIAAQANDRYRSVDAVRDFSLVEKTLDSVLRRIESLEQRK